MYVIILTWIAVLSGLDLFFERCGRCDVFYVCFNYMVCYFGSSVF